ncbi:hypothetical protein BaRGS_00018049, partial [Batillaria attramentaria]
DTEEAIRWLARRALLKNEHMTAGTFNGHIDVKRWRDGSWFEKSKITLPNSTLLLYFWNMDFPQVQVARELQVSNRTVVDWMNFIREQVGGLDEQTGLPIIVEIDESKYFHRKTRATLEPIVLQYTLPGFHIISDGWRAYGNLAQLGGGIYLHDPKQWATTCELCGADLLLHRDVYAFSPLPGGTADGRSYRWLKFPSPVQACDTTTGGSRRGFPSSVSDIVPYSWRSFRQSGSNLSVQGAT